VRERERENINKNKNVIDIAAFFPLLGRTEKRKGTNNTATDLNKKEKFMKMKRRNEVDWPSGLSKFTVSRWSKMSQPISPRRFLISLVIATR